MYKGKTSSGFEFEIDENAADNMELVDALAEAADDDVLAVSAVGKILLGKEQRKRLYDHIRKEGGRVPVKDAVSEIMEILQALGDKGKN